MLGQSAPQPRRDIYLKAGGGPFTRLLNKEPDGTIATARIGDTRLRVKGNPFASGMSDTTLGLEMGATDSDERIVVETVYGLLALASSGLGFYHGYRRNGGSVLWGLGWAFLGSVAPVITPALAFAQGFGKPEGSH